MEKLSVLKKQLLELEKKLLEPKIRTTPSELDKLLADDFFEFGSSGNVWYKRDSVDGNGLSVREMSLSEFEIYPFRKMWCWQHIVSKMKPGCRILCVVPFGSSLMEDGKCFSIREL